MACDREQNAPSAGPVSFSAVYVGHVAFGPLARPVLMGDDCHDSTPANMNLSLKAFTRVATLSVVLFGGSASLQRLWAQETPLANAPPNTVHTIEIGEHAGYRMIEYRTRGRITSLEIIREHGPNMIIRVQRWRRLVYPVGQYLRVRPVDWALENR